MKISVLMLDGSFVMMGLISVFFSDLFVVFYLCSVFLFVVVCKFFMWLVIVCVGLSLIF